MSQSDRSTGLTTEETFKAALKRAFYFPPEYGGLAVDATKEDWSDVMEVEESLSVFIPAANRVYILQNVFGIGDNVVLYTKYIKTRNVPLPQNADANADPNADANADVVSSPDPLQHCKRKGGLVNIVQHFCRSTEFRRDNLIG